MLKKWETIWKRYGKILAAAAFLTVAGLCYGFLERPDEVLLTEDGGTQVTLETMEHADGAANDRSAREEAGGAGDGLREEPGDGHSSRGENGDRAGLLVEESETDSGSERSADTQTVTSEMDVSGAPDLFVHICGEVHNPGVYELPAGSRIIDAVHAAGGLTDDAAEASMNLAQALADGTQVVILSEEEFAEQAAVASMYPAGSTMHPAGPSTGLINLNTATREQLMMLPGIGESRAGDILKFREESGGFRSIEDIMKVSGIKEAAFQKIKDLITV